MIWRPHQILTPPTDEEIIEMTPEEVLEIHRIYHEAIENAEKDPYEYGFRLASLDESRGATSRSQ
jgi:hypothetical protein